MVALTTPQTDKRAGLCNLLRSVFKLCKLGRLDRIIQVFQPCTYSRHHDPALQVQCAQDVAAEILKVGPEDRMVVLNQFHYQKSAGENVGTW